MLSTSPSLLEELRSEASDEAWGRMVRLYSPLLYHWMQSHGLRPEDASDLVQEVFKILVQKLPEFEYDPSRSFRAWLRMVALNVWRLHCRTNARVPLPIENPDDRPGPDDPFSEERHRREVVAQALEILEPEFRRETWLAFVEHGRNGRTAADVAAELGISMGAVYSAKFRVLARVREYLSGILDGSP